MSRQAIIGILVAIVALVVVSITAQTPSRAATTNPDNEICHTECGGF